MLPIAVRWYVHHARDGTKKAEAAGTCGDVTDTEDAILLSDHAGYFGIPIKLTHKETIQE